MGSLISGMGNLISGGAGSLFPSGGASGNYPAPYIEPTGQLLTEYLISEAQQPVAGLGGYQPFLQQIAQQGLITPQGYQQYMSPYQQEILSTTQQQLNEARLKGRADIAAQAVRSGAFGGGREGVQRAEYERQRDIYDASTLANLRQQGYQQALGQQQQALQNLTGLASLVPQLQQTEQMYPLTRLGALSNIFGGLAGTIPMTPGAPMLTSPALAAAQAFGGILGALSPRQGTDLNEILSILNYLNAGKGNATGDFNPNDPTATEGSSLSTSQIVGQVLGTVLDSIFNPGELI